MVEAQTSSEHVNVIRQTKCSAYEMLSVGYETVRRIEQNHIAARMQGSRWTPAVWDSCPVWLVCSDDAASQDLSNGPKRSDCEHNVTVTDRNDGWNYETEL